mmetsp:Transcript_18375/g.42465  ORF Transcript_18375/g.42465 Transcript_18375/m.42465 type:complete len:118 (-) Transcript_18375:5744-6097(-)
MRRVRFLSGKTLETHLWRRRGPETRMRICLIRSSSSNTLFGTGCDVRIGTGICRGTAGQFKNCFPRDLLPGVILVQRGSALDCTARGPSRKRTGAVGEEWATLHCKVCSIVLSNKIH